MKAKVFLISLIVSISMFHHLKGQDTTGAEVSSKKYIQANLALGYLRSTNHNFNDELRRQGYNGFLPDMINGSLSVDFFFNKRIVISSKGYYFSAYGPKQPGGFESYLEGFGFEMIFGYVFIKKNSWRLYPYIGIGGNGSIFELTNLQQRGPQPQSLDDLLNDPNRDLHLALAFTAYTLDFGLSLEKILELKRKKLDCPQNTRYLTIGLKTGYYYSAQPKLKEIYIYNLNGFYANLFIGMGTKIRKVSWK